MTTVRHQTADYRQIFREIRGEFPRSAILVAQAVIDHQLALLLKIRLRSSVAEAVLKTLFVDGALYGSYARRADAAHLLGLVGPKTFRDLELIGQMREECVRNMHPVSFEGGKIAECFCELRLAGEAELDAAPGQRHVVFAKVIYELVQGLMMRSGNGSGLNADRTAVHVSE